MKTFVKTFRGKMSYTKIDKYIDLVRRTLDPDDYFDIEFQKGDSLNQLRLVNKKILVREESKLPKKCSILKSQL